MNRSNRNVTSCSGALVKVPIAQALTDAAKHAGLCLHLPAGGTVICAWAVFWAFLVFYVLSRLGRLRVDQATELAGIDNIEHGGPAYPGVPLQCPALVSVASSGAAGCLDVLGCAGPAVWLVRQES
jgi:hypothetical protein